MHPKTALPSPDGSSRRRASGRREPMSAKGRAILATILKALEDGKAEDIVTIDLIGKTSLADAMVIASGRSQRQVAALAGQVVEKLKASGALVPKVEGKTSGDWVLIDAGDIIVHVFRPEVRSFYNLEKMWAIDVIEPPAQA